MSLSFNPLPAFHLNCTLPLHFATIGPQRAHHQPTTCTLEDEYKETIKTLTAYKTNTFYAS
jgi:hypothetical protein